MQQSATHDKLHPVEGTAEGTTSATPPIPPLARPLLRGYLHLAGAILTVFGAAYLAMRSAGDPPKLASLLIYAASAELVFAMSALYHIVTWKPQARAVLRRLDHANIFVLIAGTYTPIVFNVLDGGWRVGILVAVWALSLAGIVTAVTDVPLPRWASVGLYVLTGWVALAAFPAIIATTGAVGVLLLVSGGVLYTLGALAYGFRRPNPWPRVFGYHELFHLATLAANAAFFVFMVVEVLPIVRR